MTVSLRKIPRCEYGQVSGGKFHRLADAVITDANAWRPSLTLCGRTVTPVNYFPARADALDYCGQRARYLCSQCESAR